MFFFSGTFYTITIILQAICVVHCVRKGNQNKWIWIIIFLPVIGSLIYLFTEVFTRHQIQSVSSGVSEMISPSGSIRKLEENLRFTDTFNNRIALADAYLETGQTAKAIELYESSLAGNFEENEYAISRLIIGYYREKRYPEIIRLARKIYNQPQFPNSKAHVFYAMSLGYTGDTQQAEKEFQRMKGRYSNFEARYYYSLFLQQHGRIDEARDLLVQINDELPRLSTVEKRYHREWLTLAKESLKKIS
jgi:hypothetical protein